MGTNYVSHIDSTIPLCVPKMTGNEWVYVKECLDTNWVSSVGSFVTRFEEMVGEYVGSNYSVATINGTSALHISLLVAGVQPDDEVLVSTLTFIAPANAVRYVGAWPVFIDAEPDYWQIDPVSIKKFLEDECVQKNGELFNKSTGRRVAAILPVHILGHPCDMDPILELGNQFGLPVVEDATESLGAKYKGRMVGNIGDIGCFSFNGNKLITTGGGGMIVTNRKGWAVKANYLTNQAKDDSLEYVHNEVGYNYRLSNIQAAIGCAQMECITSYISEKKSNARMYTESLSEIPGLQPMSEAPWAESVFWMYTVLVDSSVYGMDSRHLITHLDQKGIQTRPLWQPGHLSPAHIGSVSLNCDIADKLYEKAISLPCSVGLTQSELERVLEALR